MIFFMQVVPLVAGLWLVTMALILNTDNLISAVLFKVLPFFVGISCLAFYFYTTGILKIGV